MAQKKYYAVKQGREIGIFHSWEECKVQVDGYSEAEYKSFLTEEEAKAYIIKDERTCFCENKDGIIAYVDGSYINTKKMFSFGAVLIVNGKEEYFKEAFSDKNLAEMRNVAGEIKGAEFAMKYCIENKIPELTIYYDYEGIEKWCSGAWQAKKEGTINYKKFYEQCSQYVKINFKKVRGHSGDKYNEIADKLAKSALGIN